MWELIEVIALSAIQQIQQKRKLWAIKPAISFALIADTLGVRRNSEIATRVMIERIRKKANKKLHLRNIATLVFVYVA